LSLSRDEYNFKSIIAFGEEINPEKHEIQTEVKAATFHGLKYEKNEDKVLLQCVLDV